MTYVRNKWRLFNTELRMLAPHQYCEGAITDGTYMILLMGEPDLYIDYDVILYVLKIGGEAKEAVLKCEYSPDFETSCDCETTLQGRA